MKNPSLVQGAIVLTMAAFITKILGFGSNIIQSRLLGPEGVGLIMMVMPLMGLMMTLTTLGLPMAVSRAIAKAGSDQGEVRQIIRLALAISGSISLLLVFIIITWGGKFALYFLADRRSYYSLMALTPVIPLLAVSGIFKGYFNGRKQMNPLAISQILEQLVRISLLYTLVTKLLPRGVEIAAAGAVLASVAGETACLSYLWLTFKRSQKFPRGTASSGKKDILLDLLQIGLPTTGSSLFRSLLRAIQPILITQCLLVAGYSPQGITAEYGILTGFVMPLLFFPGFINHSLALTLVPGVSEASAKGKENLVCHRIHRATRASLLVGVPSTVILFLFSTELVTLIYKAPEAGPLLRLLAPMFLFQYFHSPLQASLIGLGQGTIPMVNNFIAKGVGLALIYPLAVSLNLGIYGAALGIGVGVILETLFHFIALIRLIDYSIKITEVAHILACGLIMALAGHFIFAYLQQSPFPTTSITCLSILGALLVYLLSILGTGVLKLAELRGLRPF
ncbi:MAG: stage V sporulation protein B [Limnochordia bacterium]|jgi:stage V sporulation protein B